MRGQVLSVDEAANTGLISGDDGIRYQFQPTSVTPPTALAPGIRVDFVPVAGQATQIMILAAAPTPAGPSATPGVPVDSYNFQQAMFSFQGRLRRQHFWISWLILLGAGFVLGWIPLLGALLSIAMIWPNTAIVVKRLHDMGRSGWFLAIPWIAGIVAVIGVFSTVGIAALTRGSEWESEDPAVVFATFGPAVGIMILAGLVQLGFLLWVGISDSQRGENRFGPNPKHEG